MAAGMLLHAGTPTGFVRALAPPRPGVWRPALPARRRPAPVARISSSSDATLRAIERAECFHSEVEALVAALPAELPLEQLQEQVTPAADSALARVWRAYNAALETHPVLVKSATSLVGFLLGDVLAQTIVGADYDASRTLRLVLFGMFMDGPVGAPPLSLRLLVRGTAQTRAPQRAPSQPAAAAGCPAWHLRARTCLRAGARLSQAPLGGHRQCGCTLCRQALAGKALHSV
jgi:hypothetical protein